MIFGKYRGRLKVKDHLSEYLFTFNHVQFLVVFNGSYHHHRVDIINIFNLFAVFKSFIQITFYRNDEREQ